MSGTGPTFNRREMLALLGGGAIMSMQTACRGAAVPASSTNVNTDTMHYQSLRDAARLIESRVLSPLALTQLMLDRIDAVDSRLHSYATVMREHALAAAERATREIAAGN